MDILFCCGAATVQEPTEAAGAVIDVDDVASVRAAPRRRVDVAVAPSVDVAVAPSVDVAVAPSTRRDISLTLTPQRDVDVERAARDVELERNERDVDVTVAPNARDVHVAMEPRDAVALEVAVSPRAVAGAGAAAAPSLAVVSDGTESGLSDDLRGNQTS